MIILFCGLLYIFGECVYTIFNGGCTFFNLVFCYPSTPYVPVKNIK